MFIPSSLDGCLDYFYFLAAKGLERGVELLCRSVSLCLTVEELPGRVPSLYRFAFPPAVYEGVRHLRILAPHYCPLIAATPVSVMWYLIVVLMCVSLMTNNVEHFFMNVLASCACSLKNYLSKPFAHFKNWTVFLLLSFKSSVYILGTNSLPEI